MRPHTRISTLLVALIIFGVCFTITPTAVPQTARSGEGFTFVYEDIDGDGEFQRVAVYLVDPEVAMEAYAADPASKEGDQYLYAAVNESTGRLVGSGDGFTAFLAANYESYNIDRHEPACDVGATTAFTLTCPFPCDPDTACSNHVAWTVVVTCFNNPPCPEAHHCLPNPGNIRGITTNQIACNDCSDGSCDLQGGTVVTGYVTIGLICDCAHKLPSLTNWGLLILFLLLILSAVYVIYQRRRGSVRA